MVFKENPLLRFPREAGGGDFDELLSQSDDIAPRPDEVLPRDEARLPETAPAYRALSSRHVLEHYFLKRNRHNEVRETVETLLRRVANFIVSAEFILNPKLNASELQQCEEDYYRLMLSGEFLPSREVLKNAALENGQLARGYVLSFENQTESMYETIKQAALIQESGAGAGLWLSDMAPAQDGEGTARHNPVSVMRFFAASETPTGKQAPIEGVLGVLRVDHPDIMEFLALLSPDTSHQARPFRLGIALTDAFMEALEHDRDFDLRHPNGRRSCGRRSAAAVWQKILAGIRECGEPLLIFADRLGESNPTPDQGVLEALPTWSDAPLLPHETCLQGSINLAQMVHAHTRDIDWVRLRKTVASAVRILDNLIEINSYPSSKCEKLTRGNRKIALGVLGFADALLRLRIPYQSPQALRLAEQVMHVLQSAGHEASSKLAHERGVFPNFQGSLWDGRLRVRHAQVTGIASCHFAAALLGCAPGIEPLSSLVFKLHGESGAHQIHPVLESTLKELGLWDDRMQRHLLEHGTLPGPSDVPIPEEVRRVFAVARDISPEWHLRMQAAFQKYSDATVAKMLPIPRDVAWHQIDELCRQAFKLGSKVLWICPPQAEGNHTFFSLGVSRPVQTDRAMPHVVRASRTETASSPPAASIALLRQAKGRVALAINETATHLPTPASALPEEDLPRKPQLSYVTASGRFEIKVTEGEHRLRIDIQAANPHDEIRVVSNSQQFQISVSLPDGAVDADPGQG